jgi:hypothetical protein
MRRYARHWASRAGASELLDGGVDVGWPSPRKSRRVGLERLEHGADREFESRSLRQLVSAFAVTPEIFLKSPEFPGFSAQVCRWRLPLPRPFCQNCRGGLRLAILRFGFPANRVINSDSG